MMKVYVLLDSKYGGAMEFVGVYATRGAACEVAVDAMNSGYEGCNYRCEVHEAVVDITYPCVGNKAEDGAADPALRPTERVKQVEFTPEQLAAWRAMHMYDELPSYAEVQRQLDAEQSK